MFGGPFGDPFVPTSGCRGLQGAMSSDPGAAPGSRGQSTNGHPSVCSLKCCFIKGPTLSLSLSLSLSLFLSLAGFIGVQLLVSPSSHSITGSVSVCQYTAGSVTVRRGSNDVMRNHHGSRLEGLYARGCVCLGTAIKRCPLY